MPRALASFFLAVGVLGVGLAVGPANANTLNNAGSLTVGNAIYSWFGLAGCTTTPLCTNAQVVANGTNTGIELRPVTGVLVSAGDDLSVQIQIDSLTGAPINSFGIVTGGMTDGSAGSNVYASDGATQITNVIAAAGFSSTAAIPTSPPQSRIYASLDVRANSGSITYVGLNATTVPEPVSLALLAVGMGGLAIVRRRKIA